MSAIDLLFAQLRQEHRKALMPFVTAADPDLAFTAAVLKELARAGASLCEVGIPYSDPIADGPVIQASYQRALDQGVRINDILRTIEQSQVSEQLPLVAMVSYAIIHRRGLGRFVDQAKQSGFSGLIVPDLLVEEAKELTEVCRRSDMSLIQLVTPTTPRDRQRRIADATTGFIYYVSVTGITGERTDLPTELVDNVGWLRTQTKLPVCIGFGISKPEHLTMLAPVADGFIIGSAFIRRIARAHGGQREQALAEVRSFCEELALAASGLTHWSADRSVVC
jgi:tryptophan synthase alpha chain